MADLAPDLIAALKSPEVTTYLKALMREVLAGWKPVHEEDPLLDSKRAGEFLSMSPAAIRKAAERGRVPCLRLGRRLFFHRDELRAALRR